MFGGLSEVSNVDLHVCHLLIHGVIGHIVPSAAHRVVW